MGGAGSVTRLRMDTPSCLSQLLAVLGVPGLVATLLPSLPPSPRVLPIWVSSLPPPSPLRTAVVGFRWHSQSRMTSSPGLNLLHLQRWPPGQACSRVPRVSRWTCLQGPPFSCTGLGDLRGAGGCGCPCCWSVQLNEAGRPDWAIRTLCVGDGLQDAYVAD